MLWKSFLRDYLNFSRAERFGILGLCGCILLVLFVKWLMPYWVKNIAPDIDAFAEEIAQFRLAVALAATANEQTETFMYMQPVVTGFFYFDPNKATDAELSRLGLNDRQIRNIRNYQTSGGNFKRKEDFQKLYTISATQYQRLEPYIRIAGNETLTKQPVATVSANLIEETEIAANPQTKLQIELNLADSSLLTKLSGIGPVLAARTVRYRNLIGGFASVEQLGEVYGVNRDLVERLSAQLSADSTLIRKIPVNMANLNALVSHPYINEQQARGILYYRRLQNRINNLNELIQNNILDGETAVKIRPYLSFE